MKAVLGAEALRRKRAVAVPRQGLSFAAQALSVRHDGLLVGCFLKEGETGATLPFRLRGLKNMPGRIEKLPLRWYNEHGFVAFCSGKQICGRG